MLAFTLQIYEQKNKIVSKNLKNMLYHTLLSHYYSAVAYNVP